MSGQKAEHWAGQRERGSFLLMKFTATAARLLGRRALAPLLYAIVLYFYLFGRRARRSIWHYQHNLATWSGRAIVYKGMFLVHDLRLFYLDLQDEDYESAIGMVLRAPLILWRRWRG